MTELTVRRRDVANVRGAVGVVYLLHFGEPFGHARHYTGWTADLDQRLDEHSRGQGSALLRAVRAAGGTWELARTWAGTRARERQLKQHGATRRCPLCKGRPVQLDHLAGGAS